MDDQISLLPLTVVVSSQGNDAMPFPSSTVLLQIQEIIRLRNVTVYQPYSYPLVLSFTNTLATPQRSSLEEPGATRRWMARSVI
jgi:hypothetical protein